MWRRLEDGSRSNYIVGDTSLGDTSANTQNLDLVASISEHHCEHPLLLLILPQLRSTYAPENLYDIREIYITLRRGNNNFNNIVTIRIRHRPRNSPNLLTHVYCNIYW